MLSALRRSNYETTILDRARPQQRVPMCLSCGFRKGRRNGEYYCAALGQRAVEVRKPQVVADGQSEASPGKVCGYGLCAGCDRVRLPIAFTIGKIDIKQVNLVVTRGNPPVGTQKIGAVRGFIFANLNRQ